MTTLREDPLSASESRLTALSQAEAMSVTLGTLGVAAYTTDATGLITGYNQAAADLWGRHPKLDSDLWCGSWRLFWPNGQPMPHDQCPMATTLKENRPVRGAEAIAERPDGSRVWFVPYPTPIRGVDGELVGALNVLVDITSRKASELLVQHHRKHLEGIFRSPLVGIAEIRPDGAFSIVNERFCGIVGRPERELLSGLACFDVTHPDDIERTRDCIKSLEDGAEFFVLEKRYLRPDGAAVWVHNGVSAIRDSTGALEAAIAIVTDITERKVAETKEADTQTRRAFLSAARARLTESLDRDELFKNLVNLIVPSFGDWASVHVFASDRSVRRVAAAFGRDELRSAFEHEIPIDASAPHGPPEVMRTGRAELYPVLPERVLASTFLDEERARATAIRSAICVPLRAGSDITAALSVGSLMPARYAQDDLSLAEDLAQHASIALENSRLYSEAKEKGEALSEALDLAERQRNTALTLSQIGSDLTATLDLERLVQSVTDVATQLTHAQFGAFFYNVDDADRGESYVLYTLSGAPREAFASFPMPRNTALFGPTFRGEGVVRINDVTLDPRYGLSAPYHGMPAGHLPVRSYLAAPVVSHNGGVLGALFMGHGEPGVFEETAEDVLRGIAGWAAIAIDNARLYEAAQRSARDLAAKASELQTVLEVAPAGIGIARDSECSRIEVNREFARMLSLSSGENASLTAPAGEAPSFHVLSEGVEVSPEDLPMQVAARTGKATPPVRLDIVFDDGRIVHEYGSAAPLFDEGGGVRGSVGAFVDVTNLQRLQDDLRRALAAKDEFLGLVSHELKTPLTTIRGNSDVLYNRRHMLDEESIETALSDIVYDSERLNRIVENLLLIARAEQGEALDVEPLLLIRVVNKVVDRHRKRFPDRPFQIIEHDRPRPVEFSEACLEQVVENLISNAEKYSPAGTPIVIEMHRQPEEVIIRVLDRGVGLSGVEVDKIFEPFYRSEGARGRASGLGIGLAVCRRLVMAQGGKMWAKNREDGGAEFGFALPATDLRLEIE